MLPIPTQGLFDRDWKERLIARARERVLGLTTEENPRQLQDYGRAETSTATRSNANLEEYSNVVDTLHIWT